MTGNDEKKGDAMTSLKYRLNEKYRQLMKRFVEALTNNRPARELERINQEIKQTILQLNQTG
jgi:hypothetical protein